LLQLRHVGAVFCLLFSHGLLFRKWWLGLVHL
jgi:hypothetical protein